MLIAVNWLVFITAVFHGHLLEASLGYFINPLVNVFCLGVLPVERLVLGQASVGLEILRQVPDVRTILVPTGGVSRMSFK